MWSLEEIAAEFFGDIREDVTVDWDVNGENTGFGLWTLADLGGELPRWTSPTFKIIRNWSALRAEWKRI